MISALFFTTSGSAVSLADPKECAASNIQVMKSVLAGVFSLFFSTMIVLVMVRINTRRFVYAQKWSERRKRWKLKKWKICDVVLQLVGCAYFFFCLLYVALFLASITNIDRNAWLLSFVTSLAQGWLIAPFWMSVLAAVVPKLLRSSMWRRIEHRLGINQFMELYRPPPDSDSESSFSDSSEEVQGLQLDTSGQLPINHETTIIRASVGSFIEPFQGMQEGKDTKRKKKRRSLQQKAKEGMGKNLVPEVLPEQMEADAAEGNQLEDVSEESSQSNGVDLFYWGALWPAALLTGGWRALTAFKGKPGARANTESGTAAMSEDGGSSWNMGDCEDFSEDPRMPLPTTVAPNLIAANYVEDVCPHAELDRTMHPASSLFC